MQKLAIMKISLDTFVMGLPPGQLWALGLRAPGLMSGPALHRAALAALWCGEYTVAERLFENAALHYRKELRVEPLARLRVHQLMGRAWASGESESDLHRDVERQLLRLERIESPEPPFEMTDAEALAATWKELVDARDAFEPADDVERRAA